MEKVKTRFGKVGRTFSTSNYETTGNPFKKRSRSISEILDSTDRTPSVRGHPYELVYLGYMCVDDPRCNKDVLSSLRAVRGGQFNNKLVGISHDSGILRVAEGNGEVILVCPLHAIGLVSHDVSKGGYSDCLAISFSTGHYAKQCHAFQSKSSREAADIVQALQKALRNANKERKNRKTTESGPAKAESGVAEGTKVRRPMQFMEDEDEVIEHKSIVAAGLAGRRESKKAVPAIVQHPTGDMPTSKVSLSASLQATSTSDSTSSTSSIHKDKRKVPQQNPTGEFTLQDKTLQLIGAVERIRENNKFLRDKAELISTPISVFEDSLVAMVSCDIPMLTGYIGRGDVVNSQDSGGNTLLHYAVALGQPQAVKMLCNNNASLEAAGWNDCKPIHRAVAEGHISILQILLRHGADVNSLDLIRRTPLHFSSVKLELMECSISLLEFGAHVMTADLLGLRPFDLNPELKETRNCLVTSACETFLSAPLKNGGKESPPGGTPESTSPSSSSRPSSGVNDLDGDDLNQLVAAVTHRAQVISSRANARRKKFQKSMTHPHSKSHGNLTHPHSRSHGNLIEMQEEIEEELLKKDRLKFPSDFTIDSTHQEMRGNKEAVLNALRELVKVGRAEEEGRARNGGSKEEMEVSLSETDLCRDDICDDASPPRPYSSAAVLQDNRVRSLLGGVITKFTLDSGSSTGTLKEDADSDQGLGQAFDLLQDDLKRSSIAKSQDNLDQVRSSGAQLEVAPPHLSADSTPLMGRRTKEQTVAIFDDLILQLEQTSEQNRNQTLSEPHSNGMMESGSLGQSMPDNKSLSGMDSGHVECDSNNTDRDDKLSIAKRRVQSNDVPRGRVIPRPSSSTTGMNPPDAHHAPRAASVETELEFATLPKKKKSRSKWSGIRRIGSPLFRSTRKSFTNTTPNATPTSSKTHLSVTHPSPSVPLPPSHLVQDERSHDVTSPQDSNSPTAVQEIRVGMSSGFSGGVVRKRRGSAPRDECLNALTVMVTLSSNQECLGSLISRICLPQCVTKLIEISQNPITTPAVLTLISTLISNLYQSGGKEGKKTALGSGVLDLTIKLLQTREPIPSTCLSQLNNLLVSEDDNDYLRTIIRIPTAPLLQYLEGCDVTAEDSGYENNSHPRSNTTASLETRYSSDTTSTADEGVEGMGAINYLGLPPRYSGRSSSFNSEASDTSSGRGFMSPPSPHRPPDLDPKRIVLKMLAVSSTHSKMQLSLSTDKAISLLAGCSSDHSQANLTNALITLANIAQSVRSHDLFQRLGVVKQLQAQLSKGPHPRYHASRALVYLGHLDLLQGFDLFDPVATGYETDIIISSVDSNGHSYARGATIEKCVELLTSDPAKLWGGFSLVMGPHPSKQPSDPSPKADGPSPKAAGPSLNASKDQVLQFFLTTYKSFVHPLVLIRLLRHRLTSQDSLNLFDWSRNVTSISPAKQLVVVPPTQTHVLNLIGRWMELYSEDFVEYAFLKEELEKVVSRLKLVRGPYIPHTHRLRSLLQDTERPRTEQVGLTVKEDRPPHHDNLYRLCQQMVTGGHLPVTLQQAIFMASLQLHLELGGAPLGSGSAPGTPVRGKTGTSRLKSAFPPSFSKSKSIMKRVKAQLAEFETLSERNAKHLYIERCQANPGYDCAFFTVKVPSSGRFKRAPVARQLMGINNKRIVFLDEKSKELIASHSLQSVLRISRESDPCVLFINLHGDSAGFKVQLDSAAIAKEVANILEERREGEGILEDTNLKWSDSVPSLFTMSTEAEPADTDSSSSTIDHTPTDRVVTPPGHLLSYDMLMKNPSPEGMLATPNGSYPEGALATPNGHMETMLTQKSDTLRAFSHNDSLLPDLNDHLVLTDSEKLLFCDCPPDPEIPPEVDLKAISMVDILSCPLEVARQMTLIAHARFGELTFTELLQKVNLLPKTLPRTNLRDSIASNSTLRSSIMESELLETAVEKLAFRFNQVGNWVAHTILQFEYLEERAEVIQQFIAIAKHCYELGNFSSMMAIVVAGLGSAPIRRLQSSWAQVPKPDMEQFKEMDTLLDSKGNYKHYRDKLTSTVLPAVPYVGVFLKDLTFICDGNPDYLRGGLINMHKRRQVYRLLEEIHHYQKDSYKLHVVPEMQQYLLSHKLSTEDDLHSTSHTVEPRSIRRSHSSSSTKSLSTLQSKSRFRGLSRSGSSSGSYLNRTSLS